MFCSCTEGSRCLVALHPRSNHYKLYQDRKRKERESFNFPIMTLVVSCARCSALPSLRQPWASAAPRPAPAAPPPAAHFTLSPLFHHYFPPSLSHYDPPSSPSCFADDTRSSRAPRRPHPNTTEQCRRSAARSPAGTHGDASHPHTALTQHLQHCGCSVLNAFAMGEVRSCALWEAQHCAGRWHEALRPQSCSLPRIEPRHRGQCPYGQVGTGGSSKTKGSSASIERKSGPNSMQGSALLRPQPTTPGRERAPTPTAVRPHPHQPRISPHVGSGLSSGFCGQPGWDQTPHPRRTPLPGRAPGGAMAARSAALLSPSHKQPRPPLPNNIHREPRL